MSKKIEEILPKMLKDLSNGIPVSTTEIAKKYCLSTSGVRNHLRTLEHRFYKDCFKYDGSLKKWVAIDMGFLTRNLLEPEEVIVLNSILRNKKRLGKALEKTHEQIVNSYLKRAQSYIFKQHKAEDITKEMEPVFALLKHAISKRNMVQLSYPSKGEYKTREIEPYKIVYIEYYWYLICKEDHKIKSFRISLIHSLELIDKIYKNIPISVEKRLELAMNAYVDYQAPLKIADIFVWEKIVNHIEVASYFSAWKKIDNIVTIKDKKYQQFEVKITNPDFNDIAPTILKYMPNIIIGGPQELVEKINTIINEYKISYSSV